MSFLDPRFWMAVLLGGALLFAAGWFKGDTHGKKEVRAEWTAAKLDADREVIVMERKRQAGVDEAFQLANAREARIRRDAAVARSESDGLRHDLDAVRVHAASSVDAAAHAVATLGDVFESCVREYQSVAESADGHASDSLKYQQAWPRE